MVSAAFWGDGQRLHLLILELNFELKKNSYSTNSYLVLLEELVIPNYTNDLIFI
jgi:transposase